MSYEQMEQLVFNYYKSVGKYDYATYESLMTYVRFHAPQHLKDDTLERMVHHVLICLVDIYVPK